MFLFCWQAAKSIWTHSNVPLGSSVAVAIDSKSVWKRALKLARPQVWEYVAVYSKTETCLDKLIQDGLNENSLEENGCVAAWVNVRRGKRGWERNF